MTIIDRRRFSILGAGAPLAALLPASGARAQSPPLLKTRIANASGNMNLAVQALLRQEKFMEKFGVDAEFLNVADGSKIVGGLLGGDIDSSMMSGFGQVFPAVEKGAKLRIIAAASFAPTLALFTSKPAVQSMKDLEGKTIGVGAIGALLHQLVVALLRKNDVNLDKVRFVNVGSSADVFKATLVGTVDAGTGEAAIIDDMSAYPNLRLLPGGDMTTNLKEYTFQASWTSDRVIQAKRDTLVRSLAAQAMLYRFLHSPESREPFLRARAAVMPNSPEADGISQWNYIQRNKQFAVDLVISEERLRYIQQLNVDLKVQNAVLPMERVADNSLAEDALKLVAAAGK